MRRVNMGRILAQTANRFPNRIGLVNVERKRRFSYPQLHDLTNRLANSLSDRFGLGEGDFYATILRNDNLGLFHPWMFKSKVGAVWLDLRESTEGLLAQIDQAGPKLVFIEASLLGGLRDGLVERGIEIVTMDPAAQPGVHNFWDLVEAGSPAEVTDEYVADDVAEHIALMRFTGGTTGRAKCAMYSLDNLWTWGCNPAHYIETFPFDRPRAMFFSPLGHAASGSVVIPVLIRGGAIVTLNKADLELIGKTIQDERVQMIYAVPTVLYRILDLGLADKYDLSSIRTIRYGGASISPAKLERLVALFGQVFVQGYGSTEAWPSATILGREEHLLEEPYLHRLASIGKPFPGQEILICDDNGRELGPDRQGELWIRGANTIRGYYRDPDQTKANFSPDGFWKSGDIGYRDEAGFIYLIDRKKDLIITGGYNVYAQEVENCLNRHPAVADSAVVGVPDDDWGEMVCAAVMLGTGSSAQPEELIAHCKAHLARYKAPKLIELKEELPTSSAGKVLRREVRAELRKKYKK